MSSQAVSAFGTLVKLGDGASPESFTAIAELRNVSGPSLELETIDVTCHNTADPWRLFIGGLLNAGEVSLELNFIPTDATHDTSTGLIADMVNRIQRNFQIVFPDISTTTWQFCALVTAFEMSSDPSDVLQASVTLKLSGKPAFVS